ncbi:alpha-L-fucosidase [Sabulilitoribacter arenilitoris]|uniref:alpha-L-fucosidase n=1 Tax=Wocania arenilitoris TaxID=2044858 RepID=A0AAE3JLJ0_9FLAO|nr:alpha-L-fucosidase [Wocania arenilitoris]MCF7568252.1 alpha-L-fucosidase [Wocania arenilitoris]
MKKLSMKTTLLAIIILVINACKAQENAPTPYGPVPTENQIRWQEMEFYAFIHFSTNTFTNQEWGYGAADDAQLFNPSNLDCDQWARVCKEAGMKGIILTAKHHSGFCLWPTETTDYSVKNSPWMDGKGDIVGDLAKACKKYGLKLGIYISPWDRNHSSYGIVDANGSSPYVENIFRKQIEECLTKYGEIFEIWFDGANGGDGYYGGAKTVRRIDRKTYYDWPNTYKMIRSLQPNCVIWNDKGDRADLRWVGTESGYVGETNWSLLYKTGDVPKKMLRYGVEDGDAWVPGEVNTSIRPGWFYHESEDSRVKNLPKLMETYYKSIGRNGTFLLNFPIDKRGLIHENDEKEVLAFAKAIKETFATDLAKNAKIIASNVRDNNKKFGAINVTDGNKDTYWSTDDSVKTASLIIDFDKPKTMNRFLVQENIRLGQRIKSFTLEAFVNGEWKQLKDQLVANGNGTTTIGYKRIISFSTIHASKLRFTVTETKACPVISNIEVYNAPQILVPPVIMREKSGNLIITPSDKESEIYYTLDETMPTPTSKKYLGPIATDGKKVTIKAIAYEASSKKNSSVAEEKFDIAKKNWVVINTTDPKATDAIDGNVNTTWYQGNNSKMPIDIVVDLGKIEELIGFRYLPSQSYPPGIFTHYQFYTSNDNKNWELVDEGEFSNIKNNPLWQTKIFPLESARYIKLRAEKNTLSNDSVGYAEIDIITK